VAADMSVNQILAQVETAQLTLPEFQRGYVWSRAQVARLFESLYQGYPTGSLLIWNAASARPPIKGSLTPLFTPVKLLLDGQQRVTSLYGVIRGAAPPFFDGNAQAFSGLQYRLDHLDDEPRFGFPNRDRAAADPLWIDVTALLANGVNGVVPTINQIEQQLALDSETRNLYMTRLLHLVSILDHKLPIDEISKPELSLDQVVEIFNRVNTAGTKLSKGDLALAKIAVAWPQARDEMKRQLGEWEAAGRSFDLDWLLRALNIVMTGEVDYRSLADRSAEEIAAGLKQAIHALNTSLNMISDWLGLDHTRVIFGRAALFVMARYIDQRGGKLSSGERGKLLYWYVQAGIHGRYSYGAPRAMLEQDLNAIATDTSGLDALLDVLRSSYGDLSITPAQFEGARVGTLSYSLLYLLTRVGAARDWGNGQALSRALLGAGSALELHHIFPKSRLRKAGYPSALVNAIANFSFQTAETNKQLGNKLPQQYFPQVETAHPNALASQWVPRDQQLHEISYYEDFLQERRELLAQAMGAFLDGLLQQSAGSYSVLVSSTAPLGEDAADLIELNHWAAAQGLIGGEFNLLLVGNPETHDEVFLDLAWPDGVQTGLSQPVAVLLDDDPVALGAASAAGYRCFNTVESFKLYVAQVVLSSDGVA